MTGYNEDVLIASLVRERRVAINAHAEYVFPDGTKFRTFQEAVQAAWIAGDFTLAAELTLRFNLADVICHCCAQRSILSVNSPDGSEPIEAADDRKVCWQCFWDLREIKKALAWGKQQ